MKIILFYYFKQRKLRKFWFHNAVSNPIKNSKVIYFAFHFQPERATDPESGYYTDQVNAVRVLSSLLPSGWTIWVKEKC